MKTIEELLKNLARPEVLEFGLVTNRLPSVNIGGKFEPVDDEAPSTERLMQMLVTMGGSRHVDALNDKPVQWTTRLDGVGVIAVAAIMRKDVVQARFTVAKREAAAPRAPIQTTQPSAAPPAPPAPPAAQPPRTSEKAIPNAPVARANPALLRTMPIGMASDSRAAPTPSPQSVSTKAAAPVSGPLPAAQPVRLSNPPSSPMLVRPSAATEPDPAKDAVVPPTPTPSPSPSMVITTPNLSPPDESWQDDDEPTLQTSSPPVNAGGPRPKPARHPEDASRPPPAVQAKAAASMRRISTPTSVDAVDMEITTNSGKALKPLAPTAEPSPPAPPAAAVPAPAAPAPLPVTAASLPPMVPVVASIPPAAPVSEKERPRVEGTAALDSFLAMAVAARASDLLVVAGRPVLLRVAGDLLPRTQAIPAEHVERITKEIVPARLREALERDGSCDFVAEHPAHGRFRVNVAAHRSGYKLSLRVVPREVPTLASLGLPEVLANSLRHQRGLIIVTGPVGHGKSSTLAALVDHLNRETQRHIATVEAPIEHVHVRKKALVSQREVGLHVPSQVRGIESALKEDADVIVISDLADAEAIRLALMCAESGRLVLAAMSTPSAAKTIDRILEMFSAVEKQWVRSSLSTTLKLIVGQRLVPSTDRTRHHAAVELLPWSVALHRLIRDGRTHQIAALHQRTKSPGSVRLDDALAELVRAQKVTAEMAKQVAQTPAEIPAQAAWPAAQARKS